MIRDDLELVRTCTACPEQYDVVERATGETVGYLRLRHGYFAAYAPDAWGEIVYDGYPEGDGFFEDDERDEYLEAATAAIIAYYI